MAARIREYEQLYETLSGLRSTSKGQLKYDSSWELTKHNSEEFSNSLESFLSRPSLLLRTSQIDSSSENGVEIVSSSFLQKEKKLENDACTSTGILPTNYGQGKREKSARIAANVETKNELILREFHKESREMAEASKTFRAQILNRRMENLKKDTVESINIMQKRLAEERERFQREICEKIRQDYEESKKLKHHLDEKAKEHKRKLDEICMKALLEESHIAQEEEEKRTVLRNLKENIVALYHQILKKVDLIQKKFKDFRHVSCVDGKVYQDLTAALSTILSEAEVVLRKCKTLTDLSVAEDHLQKMNNLVEKTVSNGNKAMIILKSAEEKAAMKKKEMEEVAKAKDEEFKKEQIRKAEVDDQTTKFAVKKPADKTSPAVSELTSLKKSSDKQSKDYNLNKARCISDHAFSEYAKLQEMLKAMQESFKDFISDPKQSKYKFDLQKAVNVPINALSAHSPSHLNDKIHRLVSLLSENNVLVGGKSLNCKSHPSALAFCKDLVAKKLVMQGAQQVSSNPSSAFIYAAVIAGIWSAFPDVGQLILAHFQHSYPYLVPYYLPKQNGQSTEDYHKALGYSIVRERIEDQDNFLKKFSGTVQLYAAVMTSSGAGDSDHPHGIEHGWTWLARVLNLKPIPSVTATMLYQFIKVAGHALMKKYGRQFQKLLLVLCKEFVPAIDKLTPPEKRGPTQRLKDFLEECIKSQRIPVPDGYLTQRWWQSGHF